MKLLQGIRVLDLGIYIAGPFTASLLADLGADVIKVELPKCGEPFRQFDKVDLYSMNFQTFNRNKRSVTIDFTRPEGVGVLSKLVQGADVLVINSRPGMAAKLGIDYESMRAVNPMLIYCAISGFGREGPYSQRPAFDIVGQALSGYSSRHRRGNDPRVSGPAIADPVTGYYAALGIQAAYIDRSRTGKGHLVEVSLIESMVGLNIQSIMHYFASGKVSGIYERAALSQAYYVTCKDGKRLGLQASAVGKFFEAMCRVVGREDWLVKYPDRMARVNNYESIAGELNEIFLTRTRDEWTPLLEEAGFPFSPEHEVQDLEHDPHLRHIGMFYETEHPKYGKIKGPHRPEWVDGSREIDFKPPPGLGEHTDEVLRDAGYTTAEIGTLRASGII
ncbi:MAG: CoA transferase [Betaproteobacteria bacterium]|nr:CoA transferase [Betaproteobacteria bacterium]